MLTKIANWFDNYRIDHKVEYVDGVPARIIPLDKLTAEKRGYHWYVNGKLVSRKFVRDLQAYYA
jgi:hypothetical protein